MVRRNTQNSTTKEEAQNRYWVASALLSLFRPHLKKAGSWTRQHLKQFKSSKYSPKKLLSLCLLNNLKTNQQTFVLNENSLIFLTLSETHFCVEENHCRKLIEKWAIEQTSPTGFRKERCSIPSLSISHNDLGFVIKKSEARDSFNTLDRDY